MRLVLTALAAACLALAPHAAAAQGATKGAAQEAVRAYAQVMRALSALLLAPYTRAPGSDDLPAILAPFIDRIAAGDASPLEVARALLRGNTQ